MKISKEDFAFSHRKTAGLSAATSSLSDAGSSGDLKPVKVYLNEFGNEVHVRGPLVQPVSSPETLREKIARFDSLALRVRENRSIMASVMSDTGLRVDSSGVRFIEDDEDVLDDSLLDDVEHVDSFGEHVVANDNSSSSAAASPVEPDGAAPAGEPAAPTAKPAEEQAAEPSGDAE